MRSWADEVVAVPMQVAVAPVEHPVASGGGVAQLGDGEACPVRTDVGHPRRPALEDGDRPARHINLEPDLVMARGETRPAQ